MSGIATMARAFADAAAGRIMVLDTRKTTPLLRVLEKYAVRAGGATNHRFRLDDGVLIKDNHVRLAGGVGEAVRAHARPRGRAARWKSRRRASRRWTTRWPRVPTSCCSTTCPRPRSWRPCAAAAAARRTEISGGVTLARLPELAETGRGLPCRLAGSRTRRPRPT